MTDCQATANLESGSARAADAQVIPFCTLNLRRYYASHYEQDARQFELHKQVTDAAPFLFPRAGEASLAAGAIFVKYGARSGTAV